MKLSLKRVSVKDLSPLEFSRRPAVQTAVINPRSPTSVLSYMCGCDINHPKDRKSLYYDETVEPLLGIWFRSGTALDNICKPFMSVIRELKADPPTLVEDEWFTIEGQVARVLLADQLSRSCFRGTAEAFSFDYIGRNLVRDLVTKEKVEQTLKLPPALLYLLPWALAHSEDIFDLISACEIINMAIGAYPNFNLFEGRNKKAVDQHRQVLEKFGRYPQRNLEFGRANTPEEETWLNDKENLPIWAGGNLSFDQKIK